MKWTVEEMGVRECSKALTRYPGALIHMHGKQKLLLPAAGFGGITTI